MKGNLFKFIVLILCVSLSEICLSSDEFNAPKFVENSSFESQALNYKVIGLENRKEVCYLWVVVSNIKAKKNSDLKRIIKDLNLHYPSKYEYVNFYTSYSLRNESPHFRITDDYATYTKSKSKIYFGTASGKLYGGWLEIPK